MARKRRWFIIGVLMGVGFLLVLAAGGLWLSAPPDPVYKGKRLSQYLMELYPVDYGPGNTKPREEIMAIEDRRGAAQLALREMNGQVVPLLRKWIARPAATWRIKVAGFLEGAGLPPLGLGVDHQRLAYNAILTIPEHCGPLLNDLHDRLQHPDPLTSFTALHAFARILEDPKGRKEWVQMNGPSADLLDRLTQGSPEDRIYATALFLAYVREGRIAKSESLAVLKERKAAVKRQGSEGNAGTVFYFNGQNILDACIEALESTVESDPGNSSNPKQPAKGSI